MVRCDVAGRALITVEGMPLAALVVQGARVASSDLEPWAPPQVRRWCCVISAAAYLT